MVYSSPPQKDYSTLVHTAEQSLERKWRKYFGGEFIYLCDLTEQKRLLGYICHCEI